MKHDQRFSKQVINITRLDFFFKTTDCKFKFVLEEAETGDRYFSRRVP